VLLPLRGHVAVASEPLRTEDRQGPFVPAPSTDLTSAARDATDEIEPEAPRKRVPNDLKSLVRGLKDDAEREAIARALEHTKWNRKEASRRLGISYKALLYKIRRYGIGPT
jgi:two-component system response regulator PilR (NtrC family)